MSTSLITEATNDSVIAQDVRAFIVENFLLGSDNDFDVNTSLIESGIVDSTGIMHVVAFLEERYAIAVADDDLTAENLDSVARIARFVRSRQTAKAV